MLRGDLSVSETKLANAAGVGDLRPATEEEIRRVGAVPGYASPIGIQGNDLIVDESIPLARNLVAAHGGEMAADSAPGRGTTVSFTIPLPAV